MPYLFAFLSLVITCGLQYFLSIWLIEHNYFSAYAHTFGGFLVLMVMYMNILQFLIRQAKQQLSYFQGMVIKFSVFLFLLATFWLNYELINFQKVYKQKDINTKNTK